MPIRNDKKKENQQWVDISPQRIYTDIELADFHKKIQRFWDEPRQVLVSHPIGSGIARKFDHEALAVAFGAARKVEAGQNKKPYYLYNPERYRVLTHLWDQYEAWIQKQDWIANKRMEQSAELAGVPF